MENEPETGPVRIRRAEAGDSAALAAMLEELAAFEGKALAPAGAAQMAAWLDADDPPFHALIAESGAEAPDGAGRTALGYLAFYRAFSLFKATPVLLVENVYVRGEARGLGVGRRLLAAAAREAGTRGWRRLELNVRAVNDTADGFYRRLGFTDPGESVRRLDDAALDALAREAEPGA